MILSITVVEIVDVFDDVEVLFFFCTVAHVLLVPASAIKLKISQMVTGLMVPHQVVSWSFLERFPKRYSAYILKGYQPECYQHF